MEHQRESRVRPMTRREHIRIKVYKRLAKHYERLAEQAETKASDIRDGYIEVFRPEDCYNVIQCPLCGGRLIHTGCFVAECEFKDCTYTFLFDDDYPIPNYKMVNPLLPTNYAEFKKTQIITLTREKDPEFFDLLQKGSDKTGREPS